MKLLFSILFFVPALFTAQSKFTVSGYVTEKGSRENLPGVVVYQEGTSKATTSNPYGFYSITLPAGDSVTLIFSSAGYLPVRKTVSLRSPVDLSIELLSQVEVEEVQVTTTRTEAISEDVQMSVVNIPVDKVKDIPALLGEKDVLKVLQLMPGVQKGSEGSSGFYVRGAGPDQNLIILDDATVYNAFHLFGFFSLFNGDALKSVELTKGGFPARYGGRLSSVLDMQMKDGNKEKIRGEAGIGLISSRVMIEGPILKDKCSFLVSARRTYIDALVAPFLPSDRKAGYYFYDFNAKLNYVLSNKDRLYLSGNFGKDKFSARFDDALSSMKAGLEWGNATATARWNHLFSSRLFANTSFIFTDYNLLIKNEFKQSTDNFSLQYKSGIRDYAGKITFDFLPDPAHYIRFGLHTIYHRFSPGATVIKSSFLPDNFTESALFESFDNSFFIEDDWKINSRWRLNAGARLSNFILKDKIYLNPEPRISVRYMLNKELSLKASYARMYQYMHLLSNTGIGLPTDLWVPATERAPFMRSEQVAAGLAKDFPERGYDVSVEGYYKTMNNVLSYKEGASFFAVQDNEDPISWEDNITSGRGWSYGAEILFRKNAGKFTGWIGYTLSWTELQFDELNFGKKFFARYDRRHDASVVGVYHISERITVSGTWVYGTGSAITLPLNSYVANSFAMMQDGMPPLNQFAMNTVQDYGQQRNAFRMAPYHRMDIGIQWRKKLKRAVRTFELSFYNVYNRMNPFFYYIELNSNGTQDLMQVSLFPIIPSVSWSWKF